MKQVWIVTGLVAAALAVAALIVGGRDLLTSKPEGTPPGEQTTQTDQGGQLPWQIEVLRNGSSIVMGLTLANDGSGSTLQDAADQWGDAMQIAIIAAPGEAGTLEAFVDPASAGFINGKAIITAHLPADTLKAMRERAVKTEFMESTTRKYTLSPEDRQAAMQAPISALSFIPQANLDEATIVARFGPPAERVRSNGHLEHFLYPGKGLDIALDTEGKELLQYVAPSAFTEKLRVPLQSQR
ncbi:MAG: hypothetical protein QM742_00410 [Aquabacterium sp.]